MSSKLKRKAKKKVVNLGEYTVTLPAGNMTESFKKYMSAAPYSARRVADFLDAHSNRLRRLIKKEYKFTDNEKRELYAFYDYFVKNYAEGGTAEMDLQDLYEEKPFVLQVIEDLMQAEGAALRNMYLNQLPGNIKIKAEKLRKKILDIPYEMAISALTNEGQMLLSSLNDDTEEEHEEYKENLLYACASLLDGGGIMLLSMMVDGIEKTFGIKSENGDIWKPMTIEEVTDLICVDEFGFETELDENEEIVDAMEIMKA